jgi:hypothetical protein
MPSAGSTSVRIHATAATAPSVTPCARPAVALAPAVQRQPTCTSAHAIDTAASAIVVRERSRHARQTKSGVTNDATGPLSPAKATTAADTRRRRALACAGSSSTTTVARPRKIWLLTVLSHCPPVRAPKSTIAIAAARRHTPPHAGALAVATSTIGRSCARSAATTVTRGADSREHTPARTSTTASVVARFA